MKTALILLLTFLLSICSSKSFSQETENKTTEQINLNSSIKKGESATNDYIGFYQKYISGIRGHECQMYPSCSNYGLKTFNETNFVSAFVMTSDRLLRCGHDHNKYSLTLNEKGFKFIDYPDYDKAPSDLYYRRNEYYFSYSDTVKDQKSFLFIKKLINNQYYQEALLEIMRIEFQSETFDVDLFINKLICLKALGEYEKALFEFETKCPEEFKLNSELLFQIALIQYKLQNFDLALISNAAALELCNNKFSKPRIISLDGLLHANKYDWENSLKSYKSLSVFDSYKQTSEFNYSLVKKANQFKNKSPLVAGILSIIPGGGYAYTGHRQTAISALVINGLLAYATYTSVKTNNYGMGILTGAFNLSFYLGNIYGATKSAKRYNEQQKKSIINKLEYNSQF
jgi:putative component of membrane protein insertase Oxa1/YidC/SpoIIIJ protein YidD